MKLKDYNNKYVRLIDDESKEYVGMAYYMDADTAEEKEDILDIKSVDGQYDMFLQSDIKSIEILD